MTDADFADIRPLLLTMLVVEAALGAVVLLGRLVGGV